MIEKMLWWKKCYFETFLLSHDQIRLEQGGKLFIKLNFNNFNFNNFYLLIFNSKNLISIILISAILIY